jgi:hypothetical protein
VNISGSLPGGDGNGLEAIYAELKDDPKRKHVAVCIVDGKSSKFDADSGEWVVTARIRRIEVIRDDDDRGVCETLMRRALDKRTGREALPYDLEAELTEVFDKFDPAAEDDDDDRAADPENAGDEDDDA